MGLSRLFHVKEWAENNSTNHGGHGEHGGKIQGLPCVPRVPRGCTLSLKIAPGIGEGDLTIVAANSGSGDTTFKQDRPQLNGTNSQ